MRSISQDAGAMLCFLLTLIEYTELILYNISVTSFGFGYQCSRYFLTTSRCPHGVSLLESKQVNCEMSWLLQGKAHTS